jgi:hypothetical protein
MMQTPPKGSFLGWCVNNYWPIAMLPCKTLTTLTEFLVLSC